MPPARRAPLRRLAAFGVLLVALLAVVGPAGGQTPSGRFAPVDAPGPELTVSERQIRGAVLCPELAPGDRVLLLIHGTGTDAARNWGWGWRPALTAEGVTVCTVELLGFGLADAQLSSERVVGAIRLLHETTGEQVQLLGYSQGGVVARFALRFWPDVRPMVDDLVLLAVPIDGTTGLDPYCSGACVPPFRQLRTGSAFFAALNSGAQVFDGIDATSIYSYTDEVVTPSDKGQASTLPGAVNVAVQDICPADRSNHIAVGTVNPVAFALALDAVTHDGPTDPRRVSRSVCSETYLPGLDDAAVVAGQRALSELAVSAQQVAALTTQEPPLRCYVTASCAGSATGGPAVDSRSSGSDFSMLRWASMLLLAAGVVGSAVAIVRHQQALARRRAGD